MINIILDTNIIIKYPKLLGMSIMNVNFIVTLDVISELNERAQLRGKDFDERIELIDKGSSQGTITIINTSQEIYQNYKELINNRKIDGADFSIIIAALAFNDKGEKTKIATLDKEVVKIANEKK